MPDGNLVHPEMRDAVGYSNTPQNPQGNTLWGRNGIKKPKPPRKKRVRWGLPEVFASILILLVFQLIVTTVSIGYFVAQIVRENSGALNPDQISSELVSRVSSSGPIIFFSTVLMYVAWQGTMWYASKFRGHKSWAKDFWVRFHKHDWWKGLLLALSLFLALNGITAGLQALGVDMQGADNSSLFFNIKGPWFYIIGFFMVPILGPICEELFFRGFLMQGIIRWLRKGNNRAPKTAFGNWWVDNYAIVYNTYDRFRKFAYHHMYTIAIIMSSALFGLMHFQGGDSFGKWLVVIITGLLGMTFAIIAVKTRRLGIVIFGHVFYNSMTMIVAMVSHMQ